MLIHIIKTNYVSELTTTHLVKQDDVGMTVVTGIDNDIGHIINDSLDSYDYNVVADDNSTNEINDDLLP